MAKSRASQIEVSDEAILKKFQGLLEVAEGKRARKDLKSAMRTSLGVLRAAARRGAAKVTSKREVAQKGVALKVNKSGLGGRVHIMNADIFPNIGRGRHLYGLSFWEMGTKDGVGRNGRKHGATPAKHFFASAVGAASDASIDKLTIALDRIIAKEAARKV